jgi:hypothetical protein
VERNGMPIRCGSWTVRRRCAAVFGAILVMAWCGAGPARAAQVAYERLAKAQTLFAAIPLPQRDKIVLTVTVLHDDPADKSPVHLLVRFGGQTGELGRAVGNGVVLPPLRPDMIAGNAMVETGQAANSLRERIDITLAVPGGQRIPVRYLLDAAQQAQAVMRAGARQLAGMLAVFVTPKVHGVIVGLAGCCGEVAVLQANDRRLSFTQDPKGKVSLPLTVLEDFVGGMLTASAPVVLLDPDAD